MKKIEIPLSAYGIASPTLAVFLISTRSKKGVNNIAPYGMVVPVSYKPLVFAVGSDKRRDTYMNILETDEFVLNLPSCDMLNKLRITAIRFPSEIDEFEKAGLTPIPSLKVKVPRIQECHVHIECKKKDVVEIDQNRAIIIGDALCITIDENLHIKNLARQKGLLNPIFYSKGNYFGLGRYIGGWKGKDYG